MAAQKNGLAGKKKGMAPQKKGMAAQKKGMAQCHTKYPWGNRYAHSILYSVFTLSIWKG